MGGKSSKYLTLNMIVVISQIKLPIQIEISSTTHVQLLQWLHGKQQQH